MRDAVVSWLGPIVRRSGLAGLVAALAGGVAIAAGPAAWWEVSAELTLSGATQARTVVTLDGTDSLPGWSVLLGGVTVVALGLALAVDRHPGWTRPALLSGAGLIGAGAIAGSWPPPTLGRFPDPDGALTQLRATSTDLPVGVELTLEVARAEGAWLAGAAAILTLAAVLAARELDRR